MLADDTLGSTREQVGDVVPKVCVRAFEKITADPNQELTVVELNGKLVATFHLTFIQYLTHQGGLRAQIEAVRTCSRSRGQGIGTAVFDYVLDRARSKGCHLVQLTTDKQRPDAIRFYEALGFVATHEGMKMRLEALSLGSAE